MKLLCTLKYGITALVLSSSLLLLGCGGCAPQETQNTLKDNLSVAPVTDELSPGAQETFAFLLYDQALRQEDEEAVLNTLHTLDAFNPPVSVYIDAGIFFLESDSSTILPLLKKGLSKYDSAISLHLLYAEVLQKAKQSDEAIAHIRELIKRYPDKLDPKLELALLLVNSKQFEEAEQILLAIKAKDRTAFVNYYHAKALMGMERLDEALPFLLNALKEMPYFTEALADTARIYEVKGMLEEAREYYDRLLYETGNNPEVALRIIFLSLRLKDLEKAMEYYDDMPPTMNFSAAVASMLVEAQFFDEAENILQKLILEPNAPDELYFYLAAIAYERDNDAQKALFFVHNVKKSNANYGRALLMRMQLLIELQKLEEALNLARLGQKDIAKDHKHYKDFILTEIRLLASIQKLPEAIAKARQVVRQYTDFEEAAYLLASLLDQNREYDAALAVMEGIVKKNPNNYQALNYIGYTLAEKNRDLMRAIKLLQKAVSIAPQQDYILDSLAWALFKSGNTQEAWKVIQKAVSVIRTPDPTIWEHYGDIARSLGYTKEARKGYEEALTFNPDNAESIKKRLSEI